VQFAEGGFDTILFAPIEISREQRRWSPVHFEKFGRHIPICELVYHRTFVGLQLLYRLGRLLLGNTRNLNAQVNS
jgi:hypothetical protein